MYALSTKKVIQKDSSLIILVFYILHKELADFLKQHT